MTGMGVMFYSRLGGGF